MVETWIILSLIFPALYALANVVDKFLLEKRVKNCFSILPVAGWIQLLFGIIVLVMVPFEGTLSQAIIAFLIGIGISISYALYYYTLSFEEATRAISVWYVFPVITAILAAVFLGETLPAWKYAAIVVAAVGAVLIGMKQFRGFIMRRGFYLIVLNSFVVAINSIATKHVLETLSFLNLFSIQSIGLAAGASLALLASHTRKHLPTALRSAHFIFLAEVITFAAVMTGLAAVARAQISLVNAMSALQPLYLLIYMLIISTFVPKMQKEAFTRKTLSIKAVSVLLIVIGTFIVTL